VAVHLACGRRQTSRHDRAVGTLSSGLFVGVAMLATKESVDKVETADRERMIAGAELKQRLQVHGCIADSRDDLGSDEKLVALLSASRW
jgi:hypothetical protein